MIWTNMIFLISAFVIAVLFTPIIIKWYRKNKWIDDPKKATEAKVIHEKAVTRGGGIVIYITVAILALVFLPIDKHLIGIMLGGLFLMLIGIADDIYNIDPKVRLVVGFLAAGMVVASGIGIAFISNPIGGGVLKLDQPQIPIYLLGKTRSIWLLADIFGLIWIVGVMNFVNWSKGLDGQLPGTVGIAALIIAILSERFSADITVWNTQILALIIAGAYFGLLVWNAYPQKIMPGYGGGALAGYFLAVLSILSTTKVGTLMIVLGVPLIDALLVLVRRIIAGKSPLQGDTSHLHHTLLKMGWSKKQVAYFYWGITFLLGLVALLLNSREKLYTMIVMLVIFIGFLLWVKYSKI